jgi:hypothetical protein
MSTPWPDRPMSDRSLRVAMSGIVHDDDPEIIADMQRQIERLQAALDGPSYRAAEGYPGSIDRRPETLKNAILETLKGPPRANRGGPGKEKI